MRYIKIASLLLLVLSSATTVAESKSSQFSVTATSPPGYSEVLFEEFPDYLSAVAKNLETLEYSLLKLYVLASEIEHLRQTDYDKISGNVIIASSFNKGINEESLLESAGKQPLMTVESLDIPAINAWLEQARVALPTAKAKRLGMFDDGPGRMSVATLMAPNSLLVCGIITEKPVVQVFSLKEVSGRYLHVLFTSVLESADNAKEEVRLANEYMQSEFSLAPPNPFEITPAGRIGLQLFAANAWRDSGRPEKALPVYHRLLKFYESCGADGASNRLLTVFELALLYARQGQHDAAIKQLESGIERAEPVLAAETERMVDAKTLLAGLLFDVGQPERSLALCQDMLPACRAVYGERHIRNADLHQLAAKIYLGAANYQAAFDSASQALILFTEHYSIADAQETVLIMFMINSESGKSKAGKFYLKIYSGIDAYTQNSEELFSYPARIGIAGDEELRASVGSFLKIVSDNGLIEELYKSTNAKTDTPFNKAKALMAGAEIQLYTRYAEVSAKLAQAGASADENQVEAAEARFRTWFDEVGKAFGSN